MVKIRLTRTGRKNAPSYRIIVADSESKRDGKFIEIIGYYNPTENPDKVTIQKERYDYWISKGAQPTKPVVKLTKGTYKFEPYTRQNEKKSQEDTVSETESTTQTAPQQDDNQAGTQNDKSDSNDKASPENNEAVEEGKKE